MQYESVSSLPDKFLSKFTDFSLPQAINIKGNNNNNNIFFILFSPVISHRHIGFDETKISAAKLFFFPTSNPFLPVTIRCNPSEKSLLWIDSLVHRFWIRW